ncbi:SDR family oxidoreductase [Photobacterium damselae subsp. damselae]|uniref:SDR family oxidoreductase n=1 Tax=Photobacterium damselae subsp. damselae TaxID=85581 RepID=A0A850R3E5_PHODD|nr:SDR family oxidoreductase [Photobacterium damselae subsp. damselae]
MGKFTVFGGSGFIGAEFVKELNRQGHEVYVPERNDENIYTSNLGIVIYSAGYGDCQKDPFNVFSANVALLSSLLQKAKFNKFVYISSTRVYMNQDISSEDCDLTICHDDGRRLFNLTKLTAEELCLKSERDCLIIRPSNVYGLALNSTLFLPSIIRNAINNSQVDMYIAPSYAKDYVSVYDVVASTLELINIKATPQIVNIAYGQNVTAQEISNVLLENTDTKVNWLNNTNSCEVFPETNISKLKELIDYKPRYVLDDLKLLINEFKSKL